MALVERRAEERENVISRDLQEDTRVLINTVGELREEIQAVRAELRETQWTLADERVRNIEQEDVQASRDQTTSGHLARQQAAVRMLVELVRDEVIPQQNAQAAMLGRHEVRLDNVDAFRVALQHGANNPIVADDEEDRGEEIGLAGDEIAVEEYGGFGAPEHRLVEIVDGEEDKPPAYIRITMD